MKLRLARPARDDIAALLDWSHDRFGAVARRRYEALIARGLRAIAADTAPIASRNADTVAGGVRLYHLRHVQAEAPDTVVAQPRHFLVYRVAAPDLVIVLRVLHDAMNLPVQLEDLGDDPDAAL